MATKDDFEYVNKYSIEILKQLYRDSELKKLKLSKIDERRIGFYYLVLRLTTGTTNLRELDSMIIDTDYCKKVRNIEENEDFGIDAVYIDEEEKCIQLYNFKFRENFKKQKGGSKSPLLDSTKFLSLCLKGNFKELNEKDSITKEQMQMIVDKLALQERWRIKLIIVSNENNKLDTNQLDLKSLAEEYDIEIEPIGLDDIVGAIIQPNRDYSAKLIVDAESFLVYEEDAYTSSKSYLVNLSVGNLIRMTCSDESLRENCSEDYLNKIKDVKLEMGILYENVRGYLGSSKYNKNIIKTLSDYPERFFMFNNGITITAKEIKARAINANKKYEFRLEDIQIVNGGQTLRSIYRYKDTNEDMNNLERASVLVRVFQTENEDTLVNEIAEYTNSQNAISDSDLKSINNIQIKIEKILSENKIGYIRKVGDIGLDTRFDLQISKETLAQIIYSHKGYPDRATNQKKKLFGAYYDEIFGEDAIDYDTIVKLIKEYRKIEEKYTELYDKKDIYAQKIMYVIYLQNKKDQLEQNIELLEKALTEFRDDDSISKARKLIQKGFKDFLDKQFDLKKGGRKRKKRS